MRGNYIISRPGYSGFGNTPIMPTAGTVPMQNNGGIFGSIRGALSSLFGGQQQMMPQQPMYMPDQGIDTTTLLLGAAVLGGAAYFLLRKKG